MVMDRTSLPRILGGGYIEDYRLDLRQASFVFRVGVLNQGTLASYDIECDRVSFFEYRDEELGAVGERLQLTEIWIEKAPEESLTEEWELLISLWDIAHIRIRCGGFLVDREPLG